MLRLLRSNSTSSFALAQKAIRRLSSYPASSQIVVPKSSIIHPTPSRISPPRAFSSLNTVISSCPASPQIVVPKSSIIHPIPSRIYSPRAFSSSVNAASQSVILVESLNSPATPNATTVKTKTIYDCSQSTGFVVKAKYALCSCHGLFIPECRPRPEMVDFDVPLDMLVSFWDGTYTTAKVLGLDPAADLAVLELQHVPDTVRPLEPSIIRPRVLQSCFSLGYHKFTFSSDEGFVLSPGVPITFFSKSTLFSHRDYVSKDFYAIILQMAIEGAGKSGGPVVDEDQRAMGVLVGGAEKSMLAFVTPIQYGLRLLEYVLEKNHDRAILVNHVELF